MATADGRPLLKVRFADPAAFSAEYSANLVNGGAFVPGAQGIDLRTAVEVRLELAFAKATVALAGEVVHCVTPEMASMGGQPGIAVQFSESATVVRAKLEPLRAAAGAAEYRGADTGRRRSARAKARVLARVERGEETYDGFTRDISRSGVLLSLPGEGPKVGERVRITLNEPESRESLRVGGVAVRRVEKAGSVNAVAIEFEPGPAERDALERFVDRVQSTQHARRLGGVQGSLDALGVSSLLQMLATNAPEGTLVLRQDQEEGVIGFEAGLVCFVQLGGTRGLKALVRLFDWKQGSFEFHARVDRIEAGDERLPLPVEAAVLEALRLLEEERGLSTVPFPDEAVPTVVKRPGAEKLGRAEAAVLDLARAGLSVRRILDIVPEPATEVHRALRALVARGLVVIESPEMLPASR